MKKILIFAAFALPLLSCNKDITDIPFPAHTSLVIDAALGDYSKTSVTKEGDKFKTLWSAGDVISVNEHLSQALSESSGSSALFVVEGYSPAVGTVLNVLYPGSAKSEFSIPAKQTYTNGMYPSGAAPMWSSVIYPSNISMRNLCAVVSFTFHSDGTAISRLTLAANGEESIAGNFGMSYSKGAYSGAFVPNGGNASQIEITFSPALTLTSGTPVSINIPVLGGSYSQGFTADIFDDTGDSMTVKFFSTGKSLEPSKAYVFSDREFNKDSSVSLDDYSENILFDSGSIIVGSYNILNKACREDFSLTNTWDAAKSSISSIISGMNCDIMTINELYDTEINYLQSTLSGYGFVVKNNSGIWITKKNLVPGIIYKKSRFEKIADGIFWLSDPEATSPVTYPSSYSYTDPVDGTEYKASDYRCCIWAKFHDLLTDNYFYYFATHPQTLGQDASSSLANTVTCLNAGNIRSLVKQIPLVNTQNLPFIVAGDMNTHSKHVSYTEVLAKTGWTSAFYSARDAVVLDSTTAAKPGTCPGYYPAQYSYPDDRRIDHIFFKKFIIRSYRNIYTKYHNSDGKDYHPSDHLPIKAVIYYE